MCEFFYRLLTIHHVNCIHTYHTGHGTHTTYHLFIFYKIQKKNMFIKF